MIFIDDNTAVGSKKFMHELADAIRPALSKIWNAEEVADFDLCLLQEMIWFDELSVKEFNATFSLIENLKNINQREKTELLEAMQADPRFSKQSHAA